MREKEMQKSAGERFSAMLDRHQLGPTAFAKMVCRAAGDGTKAQHVNNWRRRGVPAQLANLVAGLLGCRPEMISAAVPAADLPHVAETSKPYLTDSQEIVIAMCHGFSPQQMAEVMRAIGWIRDRREIYVREPPRPEHQIAEAQK